MTSTEIKTAVASALAAGPILHEGHKGYLFPAVVGDINVFFFDWQTEYLDAKGMENEINYIRDDVLSGKGWNLWQG